MLPRRQTVGYHAGIFNLTVVAELKECSMLQSKQVKTDTLNTTKSQCPLPVLKSNQIKSNLLKHTTDVHAETSQ